MIEVQVEFVGLNELFRGLSNVEEGVSHLRPLWEQFQTEFQSEEKRLFDAAPWEPLSPSYAEQKRRKFGDKPLLRATDVLYKSLTEQGAPEAIRVFDDSSAEFGTSDIVGIFHQLGTGKMPARPVLAEPDEEKYTAIAGDYLAQIVRQAGFR